MIALLFVVAVAAIYQVLALCQYAFPHADDFVHIVNLREYTNEPLIRAAARIAWKLYLTSDSRWAASFINHLAIGSIDAYPGYPAPLILFALINLAALVAFFAAVLEFGLIRSFCSAVILYAVLVASYPTLNEAVFWLNSAIQYSFGLACALMLFAAIRILPRNWLSTLLLSPAILFAGANHEYTAAALVLIFAAVSWHQHTTRSPDRKHWFWLAAVAFFGLLSITFAPGNILRVQDQPLRAEHGPALARFVLMQPFSVIPRWLAAAPFITAWFVWYRWTENVKLPTWLSTDFARRSIPVITSVLALMGVLGAPIFGGYQAGRAVNWGYFVLVIGAMLSTVSNRNWIAKELKAGNVPYLMAILSLSCSLVFSSNIELARRGITKPLEPWRRTMLERIQFSSAGDVVLPAVNFPTPLLSTSGVLEDKNHWLNRAFAQFLYVRSVIPEKPVCPTE